MNLARAQQTGKGVHIYVMDTGTRVTHEDVGGSAGGSKWGVAKDATLHGMRVCCGRGTNTLAGLDWIARKAEKPALTTMSLGSWGNSMSSKAAVEKVVQNGVAVFVSAGNNNVDACQKTYAFIEATITVGASDEGDNRARFSNYGSCVDIWAPGTNIPSAGHRDDTSMRKMSGTSMATPLTAGAGALLLEREPSMSPE